MAYTDIDKPSDYFNTSLWTGDNNARTISGVGFQPDWVWEKCRSNTYSHILIDSVRGITKQLSSNAAASEATDAQGITAFNSDGYVLGTQDEFANNGNTFVAWNWKAGTSFTNDASGTGIGSIDSAGSFNNDSGFSIVSYTGTGSNGTLKHGLNSTPSTIIVKERGGDGNWIVYHSTLGNGKYLSLTDTGAAVTASNYWNNTSPTSSVFTVGTTGNVNGSSKTYIAYCFAEKQGYSKFGSYLGNGSTNGSYIHLGFKPAFFLQKKSSASGNYWNIWGYTSASGSNPIGRRLFPNVNAAESNQDGSPMADFCSNGVKLRQTDSDYNGSGATYIYMAFAENPFVTGSSAIPTTAR